MKNSLKKTLVSVNSVNFGSTGGIMLGISEVAEESCLAYTACAKSRSNQKKSLKNQIFIGSIFERILHMVLSKATGFNGCFSNIGTYRFLKKLDKIKPDILHLHNLHNAYINLPMLFHWIKKRNIKVVWTLHDCWAFTGQCPHFTAENCYKWKTGCYECKMYKAYPSSLVDRTKTMYRLKKKWFTGVKNMTLVTPSSWLAGLVKQSFLKEYEVKVINNGIDLSVFKPTESDLRERHGLKDKTVLLGCAAPFGYRKGYDVFLKLAELLDDSFKIILVGLSPEQVSNLPGNIIGIERTSSREELAKYYTMADIFVNPTREDNFPTVNIEALACGTPVITFDSGGSPECVDEACGTSVRCGDITALYEAILKFKDNPPHKADCIKRSKCFDMLDKFKEYVEIYGR